MAKLNMNLAKTCGAAFLAAIVVTWASPSRAEDRSTEEARQHYESGTRHYDLGHWDEAIAEYEKAYELRADPSFLYNLAQVYRRKGDARRALDLYKNYLRKVPKSPQREEVEEKIAALQKQLDEAAGKPAPLEPTTPPAPPVIAATPGEPVASPPAVSPPPFPSPLPTSALAPGNAQVPVVSTSAPAAAPQPGRGLRTAGIACGSVGAAAVLTGAYFGLRARSLSNKVQDADKFKPADQSAGQRAQTLQWVFYGIGAGAVVTGGVLYYLGVRATRSPSLSLAPLLGPDSAGLSAMGVF